MLRQSTLKTRSNSNSCLISRSDNDIIQCLSYFETTITIVLKSSNVSFKTFLMLHMPRLLWVTIALTDILLHWDFPWIPFWVQVSVFGYGADEQGNWHHYWEENRYAGAFRKTGVHSAEFETQIIHNLAKEGKIRLHWWRHYRWSTVPPGSRRADCRACEFHCGLLFLLKGFWIYFLHIYQHPWSHRGLRMFMYLVNLWTEPIRVILLGEKKPSVLLNVRIDHSNGVLSGEDNHRCLNFTFLKGYTMVT